MNTPKNIALKKNKDFFVAMLSQTPVTIWMDGSILDYGGVVQMIDQGRVKINDMYYVRSVCEFRTR